MSQQGGRWRRRYRWRYRGLGIGGTDLTLHYNYLLNSGSTIAQSVLKGPPITHTRSTGGRAWDSAGLLSNVTTNNPRYAHDPADSNAKLGLLLEGQGDALCLETEDFGTTWTDAVAPLGVETLNSTVAPDGETTADTLGDDAAGTSQHTLQTFTIADDSNSHTAYFFIKKTSGATVGPNLHLDYSGGTGIQSRMTVDTDDGTRVPRSGFAPTKHGVIDAGDYWRFWMSKANNGTGNTTATIRIYPGGEVLPGSGIETASATGTKIFWGCGSEINDIPSSYIPVTTSSVTRAKDVFSSTVTSILGASNTLAVSGRTGLGAGVVCQIDDGTENERYRIERNASNEMRLFVTDGGAEQVGASGLNLGTVADNTDFKLVIRLAANDFASSLDGAAVVTDTSGTLPTVTTLREGMDTVGNHWNSTRSATKLWNVGKPDAFLISEAAA